MNEAETNDREETDTTEPPAWLRSVAKWPGRLCGARGDEIVEGTLLATEAWGEAADGGDSGLTAFAYLWRRFGPPPLGSDDVKDIARYVLGTPEDDVFLTISPSGSPLSYAVGYVADPAVRERVRKPARDWEARFREWWLTRGGGPTGGSYWKDRMDGKTVDRAVAELGEIPDEPPQQKPGDWRNCGGEVQRVNTALLASLRELLRPVFVRDVPINVFGRVGDDCRFEHEAPRSKYAGYGIPLDKIELDETANGVTE